MIKEKLTLIPYCRACDISMELADYIVSKIPREERDNNSWWYLHGELETLVDYDKGVFINCKSSGHSKETIDYSTIIGERVTEVRDKNNPLIHKIYVNGEIPVKVIGSDRPAIFVGYTIDEYPVIYNNKEYPFWRQCGFVVFADDTEALKYARNKVNNL